MLELFDESHYFICSGGMKPARFKANQNIAKREDGNYYLTVYSLRCKGIYFACRWAALLYAIVGAAMALLMASGVGWILLAAIIGAAVGAGLGAMMCGDMAAILRAWVVIKTDAEITGFDMVPNRPGIHMNCKFFGNTITYVPNVKNEFTALALFAGNILGAGLEGFMYVYGARGVGLLVKATPKFLCNFATNYLASLTMKGVAMRGVFAAYSATNAYYTSPTEGFDKERVGNAALDGGLFVERAAWRLYQGVANEGYKNPETGKTDWGRAISDAAMMLSMGGIPAGKGGNDATPKDVTNMAQQVASEWRHPTETAKAEIGKVIETAKQFREQLKQLVDGKGAHEKPSVISEFGKTAKEHAYEEMQKIIDRGEKVPASLEVAVNKNTGEILIGRNKGLNPEDVHPETDAQFREGNKEKWDRLNCSEADIVDQINRKGDNPNDYEYHAVEYDKKTGTIQDKHTCRNCDENMKEQINNEDVTSNTEESLSRRNAKIEKTNKN